MMKLMTPVLLAAFTSSLMVTAAPRHPGFFANHSAKNRAEASSGTIKAPPRGLPIINDDYERARAEANKRKLPLFVEVWAPW